MKKILLIIASVVIASCSKLNLQDNQDQLSQTERTCRGLKRSIIFNESSKFNSTSSRASETEKAEMLKQYKKYNCTSFEKKK